MSVASKTNTRRFITVVLSSVAALIVLPTWADTTQGINTIPTVSSVVSTSSYQPNQDLSQLRIKLTERFSWIVTEARSLISSTTNIPLSHESTLSSNGTAFRTIDVRHWIWTDLADQDFFTDIVDDPYRWYINRLAAYNVLIPSQKFFPQNYFRTDDFILLLTKLYKRPIPQAVLWIADSAELLTKWMLQQIMYDLPGAETAYIDGNPYDKLMRAEWAYYLVRMFDVPSLPSDPQNTVALWNAFNDIVRNPHADDINTLASLGVLNTQSNKFYPDNYLRHYDFVILFINTLLTSKNDSLSSGIEDTYFADVDDSATYFSQLIYAANRGLIDHLIISRRGQLYFEPNALVTQDDVYHTLSNATNVKIIHNDDVAENTNMSRSELVHLLVDIFQLQQKEQSSTISSWNTLDTGDLSMLLKLKTLLSMF